MIRRLGLILILLLGLVAGIFLTREYFSWQEIKVEEESQVLLERIRAVNKLITVEGHFTEILSHKKYLGWDIPGLRKSALVRVTAKVSVGFDLNSLEISMRPDSRQIVINTLPEPEILSIDHRLDYYDISEGTFYPFTEADHNAINHRAKDLIRAKVAESGLYNEAEKQGQELIRTIQFLAESTGWQLKYKEGIRLMDADQLLAN